MIFHYQITLLWALFGIVSWALGRLSHTIPKTQRNEFDILSRDKNRHFIKPPNWITFLCALPSTRDETFDPFFIQIQLGGFVLIILSIFIGFTNNSTIFIFSILISIL